MTHVPSQFVELSVVCAVAGIVNSPRPSVTLKPGITNRKRALSHSPLESSFDIESLTRSSEGSLHLRSVSAGHSSPGLARSSGGSYGHLSAGQCRLHCCNRPKVLGLKTTLNQICCPLLNY